MGNSQRKYICSFCAKSFSRSEHRTRHERSHTGYKPFQCKICKHSFVRRDLVQRHIRTVHRVLLLASKKNGFDPQNDIGNIALKEGFTFIQNDKKKIEINDNKKKVNKKSSKSKKDNDISDTTSNSSTSSSGSSSSDDQTIDDLVRQMIHVRDMPKESELEKLANTRKTNHNNNNKNNQNSTNHSSNTGSSSSSSNGNNGIASISNSTSSSATAVSDMNDDKTHLFSENILNLNNKTSLLRNDGDNTLLKQLYLNPVNDSFNSHLTNNVIGKFNLSYYSDQLLKNFNFGMTALRDNQIFLNSIRRIYEVCNYDNDKFFNVAWVAKREGFLPILGVSISCLGNFVKNNVYDQNLWILCWNQAMNSSSEFGKPDILSISILIYIIIRIPQGDKTCLDVYQFFQQSLLYMINQLDSSKTIVDSIDIKSFDIWNIFDIWVLLTKITDTFDNASSIIYKWFLKQNNLFTGFSELTLYDFLNSRSYVIEEKLSLATLNILPDTLYCEANNTLFNTTRNIFSVGSFKSTEDLHNLIIKINQKFSNLTIKKIISETADTLGTKKGNDHLMNVHDPNFNLLFQDWKKNVLLLNAPVKFSELLIDYAILPQSNNHWLLWECTWFEFLKSLSPADLVYKKTSFLKLQVLQSIYLDGTMINNNLALCTTPIIALLENHSKNADLFSIDNRFVTLIVDILAFQLKFFSTELVSSQLNGPAHIMGFLANPMVQLILYVWFSVIYKDDKGSYVTTNVESESVIRFVEKYIIDKDKKLDTDKLLEQDINEILFNNRSPEFIGFHCLIDSIASYIKDEVIIKRLFPLPSLNQETRFKLFEFLKLYEKDEPEMTSAPMVKTPSYSHRPSISSIGSNPFNLPTSPTSCTPTSKRRSSVVSMTEDGQKLLLPPLNFVPGQLLASPSNKRNSIPNSNYFENPGPKVPLGTYNDTFGNVPQPILHSGNPNILNHLNNYSYGGKNSGNHQEFGKINGSGNLYAYDNDTRPSGKWLHSRRASLPVLSSNKTVGAPVLPSVFPVIVNSSTIGEAQPLRPADRLSISKDRMSNERSTHN